MELTAAEREAVENGGIVKFTTRRKPAFNGINRTIKVVSIVSK